MSDNPILQVGNYIFSGEYKETVGTAMFFAEHSNEKTGKHIMISMVCVVISMTFGSKRVCCMLFYFTLS